MKTILHTFCSFIMALMTGCASERPITNLQGTYRTTKPYAPSRNPPAYLEAIFTSDGTADVYLASETGKIGDSQALALRYRIENDTIIFTWPDMPVGTLFDPPQIAVHDSDTLKLLHDGGLILKKTRK